jgi:hypothetical protein
MPLPQRAGRHGCYACLPDGIRWHPMAYSSAMVQTTRVQRLLASKHGGAQHQTAGLNILGTGAVGGCVRAPVVGVGGPAKDKQRPQTSQGCGEGWIPAERHSMPAAALRVHVNIAQPRAFFHL